MVVVGAWLSRGYKLERVGRRTGVVSFARKKDSLSFARIHRMQCSEIRAWSGKRSLARKLRPESLFFFFLGGRGGCAIGPEFFFSLGWGQRESLDDVG